MGALPSWDIPSSNYSYLVVELHRTVHKISFQYSTANTSQRRSECVPGALLSYDLDGGGNGLALAGMGGGGRLSRIPIGLFKPRPAAAGIRLPRPLARGGKARGNGRFHGALGRRPIIRAPL